MAEGHFAAADVAPALDKLAAILDQTPQLDILADAEWVRTASRIESALIPGVHYEVYERKDEAHARAWVLRETDQPRPS